MTSTTTRTGTTPAVAPYPSGPTTMTLGRAINTGLRQALFRRRHKIPIDKALAYRLAAQQHDRAGV